MEIDKIAFEGPTEPDRGYTMKVSYLKEPDNGDALVEIFKDSSPVRQFRFPAYKINNLQAHFGDIVNSEIAKNMDGYEEAAWNGIS